jgi:hypothetical protein
MKNFHDFYFGIPVSERDAYCKEVGTTISYAERLAGGFRLPSLGMAKRLIDAANGEISFHSLIATWEAKNGPLA